MPNLWCSKETHEKCYKQKGTCDENGNPRTICHHIDGNHYNDDPENLIWVSVSEHSKLHPTPSGESSKLYGIPRTDEVKNKISEHRKMRHATDVEFHNKMVSIFNEAMHRPEVEEKRKLAKIGKHWFTDGTHNRFCKECPEGYHLGITKKKRAVK